jgi:hypothetical protein
MSSFLRATALTVALSTAGSGCVAVHDRSGPERSHLQRTSCDDSCDNAGLFILGAIVATAAAVVVVGFVIDLIALPFVRKRDQFTITHAIFGKKKHECTDPYALPPGTLPPPGAEKPPGAVTAPATGERSEPTPSEGR